MNLDIKINSLYICVKDMKRAIEFYEKFLEQTVLIRDEVFSIFDIRGFRFCLFNNSKVNEKVIWGDNCLPSFEVNDIDELVKKLESLGAKIVFPLTKINDNWVLEFKDTEGNDIEIYSKCELQAVFIDRDGTIGGTDDVIYPGEFELFPFAKEAITVLKEKGIKIFSFTNQPGISRGEASVEDFISELRRFGFDYIYICPHQDGQGCKCRKPGIELLENAADKHNLDLKQCVVIGDRWSDMLAAARVGAVKILVLTGAGKDALGRYRDKWAEYEPDYVADNILDAVRWMQEQKIM